MREAFGYAIAAVVVAFGVFMCAALFRFSVLSSFRTRRARASLRRPDPEGVERIAGCALPSELARMYSESPFIERVEFELVDRSKSPPAHWSIGEFSALVPAVVREMRAVSGVRGVPIAGDIDKGTYFVDESGAVMLASPSVLSGQILVASTVRAFAAFEAREPTGSDA